jgi:hypothetical protein
VPIVPRRPRRRTSQLLPERPTGCEPVYVRAAELPSQLADDTHLRIETVDSAPPEMEVIELLKPERVQDPTGASVAPPTRKRG